MTKIRGIYYTLFAVLLSYMLSSCNHSNNIGSRDNKIAPEEQVRSETEANTLPNTALYNEGDVSKRDALEYLYAEASAQIIDDNHVLVTETRNGIERSSTASVILFETFIEEQQEYLVILTIQPSPIMCQACAAVVAGALFSKNGNNWKGKGKSLFITQMGYGEAQARIVQIGHNKYGFILEDSVVFTGTASSHLVIISTIQEKFQVVASLDMGQADVQTNKWKYTSFIKFVKQETSNYYDIELTKSGTNEQPGGITQINITETYTFNGREYVLTQRI